MDSCQVYVMILRTFYLPDLSVLWGVTLLTSFNLTFYYLRYDKAEMHTPRKGH